MLNKVFRAFVVGLTILAVSACSAIKKQVRGEIKITISNQSPINICEVYFSDIDANFWCSSVLIGEDTIPAGSERTFTLAAQTYDLLARSCAKEVVYSISDISGDFTAVIGSASLLPVRAVNRTDFEICYVYSAPAGSGAWSEDLLGSVETILPANVRWFFLEEGLYNLRAEDCDHHVIAQSENFNPASGQNWEIGP